MRVVLVVLVALCVEGRRVAWRTNMPLVTLAPAGVNVTLDGPGQVRSAVFVMAVNTPLLFRRPQHRLLLACTRKSPGKSCFGTINTVLYPGNVVEYGMKVRLSRKRVMFLRRRKDRVPIASTADPATTTAAPPYQASFGRSYVIAAPGLVRCTG